MNKRRVGIISVLSFLIIACLFVGVFFMIRNRKEEEIVKNAVVIVELKENMNAEFLSEVRVSDFIDNINGVIEDDYLINTKELGEKEIKFKYTNDDGIKLDQSFKINVVDTVTGIAMKTTPKQNYKYNDGTGFFS